MNETRNWAAALALAGLALCNPHGTNAASQDEYVLHMKGAAGPLTVYVTPKAVRRTEPALKVDVIYRLTERKIIQIDHGQKTYIEMSVAEARAKAAQFPKFNPNRNSKISPQSVSNQTFTRIGPGDTVAGYATVKYVIKSAAGETEIFVAPALAVPASYYETTAAAAGPFGSQALAGDWAKHIEGMIVKRVSVIRMMGGAPITEVTTSVDKSAIPPSTFEPPAGYRKVLAN